jgi:hypothetical protein
MELRNKSPALLPPLLSDAAVGQPDGETRLSPSHSRGQLRRLFRERGTERTPASAPHSQRKHPSIHESIFLRKQMLYAAREN